MGLVMWTLVGRFGMSIFVSEQSGFFFMRAFVRITDPMIKAMDRLTPGFLVDRLRPLYVAWFHLHDPLLHHARSFSDMMSWACCRSRSNPNWALIILRYRPDLPLEAGMTLVAVDVGGTNVRFALVGDRGLLRHAGLLCRDYPTFEDALSAYLATLDTHVTAASIAVAGPVQAPHVEVTNNGWRFGKRELMAALGFDRLLVVNDFTAQALAQSDPTANGNLQILDGVSTAMRRCW